MNIDRIIQEVTIFAQSNMIIAAVIGLFVIFLLFRHTKVLLLVLALLALAYGVAEFFDKLRSVARM